MEYFVTDKKAVQKISKHIEDGSFIDGDTLDKIKASKQATVGISYTRQMAYATMDLKIYSEISDENVSSQEIVDLSNGVFANVYLAYPEGSAWITNFNHILGGGYDAGYYGYGWSDVIAADIASEFESSPHGYYDKELGKKYRKHILESGSSRSVEESIENFLGRPFNNKAFLKNLGLDG